MTTISMYDYKFKKMEQEFFEFYTYMEKFFGKKTSEKDVVKRLHFYFRAICGLCDILHGYLKSKEASSGIKKIVKVYANGLRRLAEDLENV